MSLGGAGVEVDGPIFQAAGLALDSDELTPFIHHKIVPLIVSKGLENHFACTKESGKDHPFTSFAYCFGIAHISLYR